MARPAQTRQGACRGKGLPPVELESPGGEALAQQVGQARQAQPGWASQSVHGRLGVVRRLRHAMASDPDTLARQVPQARRALVDTLAAEVLPLLDACRFLERRAPRLLAPQRLGRRGRPLWLAGTALEIQREPLGVVLIIAPANYPLLLPAVQVLQALVAGNAVLLKPGVGGGAVAAALAQACVASGLETHLLQVLPESPAAVQAALAAGVDKVVLTGSGSTGEAVLAALAPYLVPAILELSGCDAAFVLPGAPLDLVVGALAFGLRLNQSATCIAPRRVFVHRSLAAPLADRLVRAVQAMAPCTLAPHLAMLVQTLVHEACAHGARHLTGAILPGPRMTPTVLADAAPTMRLLQTDLFAPLVSLVPVDTATEALDAAARCPYALGATVFGPEAPARALAGQVRAGVVVVNDVIVPTADPRLPFGGRGRSGYGVTRGAEGLLELTAVKAIVVRRGRWRPHYTPATTQDETLLRAYLAAVHGQTWGERLRAILAGGRVLYQRWQRPERM